MQAYVCEKNVCNNLVGNPEGKKPLRRPMLEFEDNI
jgi:hypothetical protein